MKNLSVIACSLLLLSLCVHAQAPDKVVQGYGAMAELLQKNPNDPNNIVAVAGIANFLALDGGSFEYVPSSTTATNATDVFKPLNWPGRWLRFGGSGGGGGGSTNGLWFEVGGGNTFSYYLTNNLQGATITNSTAILAYGYHALETAVIDGASQIYAYGVFPMFGATFTGTGYGYHFAFGDSPLANAIIDTSYDIFAIGDAPLGGAAITNASDFYAIGAAAGQSEVAVNGSHDYYAFGNYAGGNQWLDGVSDTLWLSDRAGRFAQITNSLDIVAIGGLQNAALWDTRFLITLGQSAGNSISGSYTNVILLGEGATIEATGQDRIITGPDMSISVGNTNQWKFKGVAIGASTNITVNINGTDYTFQAW